MFIGWTDRMSQKNIWLRLSDKALSVVVPNINEVVIFGTIMTTGH